MMGDNIMIFIDNRQNKIEVTEDIEKIVTNTIEYTLQYENVSMKNEVSVAFMDNEQIRKFNKEYRNIDRATDVLSFPMLDYPKGKTFREIYTNFNFDISYFDDSRLVLGDIALSLERAKEQSIEYNHSFIREVAYLTIHSVLHLLGYDHIDEDDKVIMRAREEEILESLNILR